MHYTIKYKFNIVPHYVGMRRHCELTTCASDCVKCEQDRTRAAVYKRFIGILFLYTTMCVCMCVALLLGTCFYIYFYMVNCCLMNVAALHFKMKSFVPPI